MTDVAFVAANPAPRTIAVLTSFRAFTASSSRLPSSLIGSPARAVQVLRILLPLTRLHLRNAPPQQGIPLDNGAMPVKAANERPDTVLGATDARSDVRRPPSPPPPQTFLHRFLPFHRAPPGRSAAAQAVLVWRDESSPGSPPSHPVRIRAGRTPQPSTARYRRDQPAPIGDAGETSRARARDEKRI